MLEYVTFGKITTPNASLRLLQASHISVKTHHNFHSKADHIAFILVMIEKSQLANEFVNEYCRVPRLISAVRLNFFKSIIYHMFIRVDLKNGSKV